MTGPSGKAAPPGAAVLLPCGCPAREVRDIGIHQDGCSEGPHALPWSPRFVRDDGGRTAAGYRGTTGDCACRAVAIATGRPYQEVYDLLIEYGNRERASTRKRSRSHPRTGVYSATLNRLLIREYGAVWTPTTMIGSGTLVHVRADELPRTGRHVLRVSKHFAAWVDGVLRDTHDCSREGTRAVYGYWTLPTADG